MCHIFEIFGNLSDPVIGIVRKANNNLFSNCALYQEKNLLLQYQDFQMRSMHPCSSRGCKTDRGVAHLGCMGFYIIKFTL